MKEKIKLLFEGLYFDAEIAEKCIVKAEHECESNILKLLIESDELISANCINKAAELIKEELGASRVLIYPRYPAGLFGAEYITEVIGLMKHLPLIANGFLDDIEVSDDGEVYEITISSGREILLAEGIDKEIEKHVKWFFGVNIKVEFSNSAVQKPEEETPIPVFVSTKPPEAREAEKNGYSNGFSGGFNGGGGRKKNLEVLAEFKETELPFEHKMFSKNAKLILGKSITQAPADMISFNNEDEETASAVLWGEVFSYEVKPIKQGKSAIILIGFTDYTSSETIKIFTSADKADGFKIMKNSAVLVSGEVKEDEFLKETIIEPKSIMLIKTHERADNAEVGKKRCELHLHTNMSDKDATTPVSELVNQAFKWGHRAIAITDHGNLQAYPEAMNTLGAIKKKNPDADFKVVYGVEAYFVRDNNGADYKKEESFHMIILVRNQAGLKNLYKLVSLSNIEYFYKKPRIPLSELEKHRDGLLIGSACEAGELFQAVLEGMPEERLLEIAQFYDYLEIQPTANNEFLVRRGAVDSELKLQIFNRRIVELGKKLGKPVVAACDVHFMNPRDSIFREILMAGQGYKDASNQAPLYFRTTEEMLEEFAYLGEDIAYETVVTNTNKIADEIEQVRPIPNKMHAPVVPGADEAARKFAYERARELFGENLPEVVEKRLERELKAIINNGFAGLYIIARDLIKRSEECGYLVASRGSVGSSFAATMLGVSEVNPLPPHYRCPECRYSRFIEDGSAQSGFDLPPENCPSCNASLIGDGHDIPFETFMGFKGDKSPDIDLNFSGEYQSQAHKHTEEMFGKDYVFKAGTITAIQEKTAFGFVKKYLDERNIIVNKAEINRLVKGCTGVKQTTGQHPGGMMVVPKEYEIYDFAPIQHPGTQKDKSIVTTHFDYGALDETLLKLDLLGHDVPTLYKHLEHMTGVKIADVPTSDKEVMSLFTSVKALKLDADYDPNLIPLGVYGLPEFGTENTIRVTKEAKPKLFSDLLQISGLTHGEGIWQGNAQELIKSGQCTISTVIGTRDNIMVYLMHKGMEPGMAFKITEITRKGGAQAFFDEEIYKAFEECNIEEWYIESCKKIKYMFPKAHAAAYVTGAVKLGWFKINYPCEFYAAVLTKHTENIDIDCVLAGKEAVKRRMQSISANKDALPKDKSILKALYVIYEMLCRGINFLPIRYKKSDVSRYVIEDGNLRLPFLAVEGCGESAAEEMKKVVDSGDFISVEDIKNKAGLNNTVVERFNEMDVFDGLPQSAQMSLFDF